MKKKVKKKVITVICLIIGICILSGAITYYFHERTVKQIEEIVQSCVRGEVNKLKINEEYGWKIYNYIQDNWDSEGGIKITQTECYATQKNWKENYIWVTVAYQGRLKNGRKAFENEYFKVFFTRNKGKVYITKTGYKITVEEDVKISDLDA